MPTQHNYTDRSGGSLSQSGYGITWGRTASRNSSGAVSGLCRSSPSELTAIQRTEDIICEPGSARYPAIHTDLNQASSHGAKKNVHSKSASNLQSPRHHVTFQDGVKGASHNNAHDLASGSAAGSGTRRK